MKLGILQTGRSPEEMLAEHGDYDGKFRELLSGHGFTFETFPVLDNVFPTSPHDAEGWIITGSRFGAYEDHDWIPPLEELIREIYAQKVPMAGFCFGHQIIAQALGGKVEKFSGGWALGATQYAYNETDTPVTINAWHQDQVIEKPADARVIAENDFCKYAALAYGDDIVTWQPHPEFGSDFIEGLLEARRHVVPKEDADNAERRLNLEISNNLIANHIAEFFKERQKAV